jgi:flavin reductase (DIM6/NTAB) family NADH-FMN oxidoreductase RutF
VNLEAAKKAIYCLTYGVYVITTRRGEEISAMTAVWVSQVSKDPLEVVLGLTPESCTTQMLLESGIFAINVLSREQEELAYALGRTTSNETDKFIGIYTTTKATGSPILCDSVAFVDCRVVSQARVGSHFVIIGEVVEAGVLRDVVPAVYRNGKIF